MQQLNPFFKFQDETNFRIDLKTVKNYYTQVEFDRWCTDYQRRTTWKIIINEKKELLYYDEKKFNSDFKALDSTFFPDVKNKRTVKKEKK